MLRFSRTTTASQAPLLQRQIPRSNMCVQVIPPIAFLMKRPEQSAMRFAKGASLNSTRINRSVDARIIARVAHLNNQFARMQLRILIADNTPKLQVPRGHA